MYMILGIISLILSIFAIADVLRSSHDTTTKLVVIALIVCIPIIGAGVYLLIFRDKGY